jgi:hypothetical protein
MFPRIPRLAGILFFGLCVAAVVLLGAESRDLYLIDAHSQIDGTIGCRRRRS